MHQVAIIGVGRIGSVHLELMLTSPELGLRPVAVHASSATSADSLRRRYDVAVTTDLQAIMELPTVEAVLICSPTPSHLHQVMTALEAGHHVFCEKPLTERSADTLTCIAAAHERGLVLQVGFHKRHDPALLQLRDVVQSGQLGVPLTLRISSRDPEPPPDGYPRSAGGIFSDSMIHDFDLARFLLDSRVSRLTAAGGSKFDRIAAAAGDYDMALALLEFEDGVLASLEVCRTNQGLYDQRFEVHGTDGTAAVGNQTGALAITSGRRSERWPGTGTFAERYRDAYRRQLAVFADALSAGRTTFSPRHAYEAQLLAEHCILAAQEPRQWLEHSDPAVEIHAVNA